MEEIFDKWNILKQEINNKKEIPEYKEMDIFFANIGKNIGSEENGKNSNFIRPIIIIKKFSNTLISIPLTSKEKNDKFHFEFIFLEKKSWAILSQIKLLDSKRLIRKIGKISKNDFKILKEKIINLILK